MRKPQALLAVLVILFAICPPVAFGWSRIGHQAVALIAEHRLSTTTLSEVRAILGPGVGLADISACADNIKRRSIKCADAFDVRANPSSRKWHYINIPIKDSPNVDTIIDYCRIHGKTRICIIDQVESGIRVLRDPAASRIDKQIALMFIVHFVGDIHMPLHNAFDVDAQGRGDGGGNGAEVSFMQSRAKTPSNLHHVWDNAIMTDQAIKKKGVAALTAELEADMRTKNVSLWLKSSLAEGALESFEISKTVIYPAYHASGGKNPGRDYQEQMQPIAFERIEKAGARLAALLETAYTH